MTATLTACTLALLAIAICTEYRRTESVTGQVIPIGSLAKIISGRPGRILKVYVREGQHVERNQRLLSVAVENELLSGDSLSGGKIRILERQAALTREEIDAESARSAFDKQRLLNLQRNLDKERATLNAQISLHRETAKSARLTFETVTGLIDKGFMTKLAYEQRRQAWLSAESQLEAATQQLAQLDERRDQARADLGSHPGVHAAKLAELHAALEQVAKGRLEAEDIQGFTIRAPISGRATAVQAYAGAYSNGRAPLLTIVPERAPMEVLLYAPSRAIGFVRAGQDVRLRYDAFPYQKFGSFRGRIATVSRTVLAADEVDGPLRIEGPVYQVRVKLDRQAIYAYGEQIPLHPGMSLSADIILERRSFFDWLLEPLRAIGNRR